MIVGIPKEIKDNENRVSLTPAGALELIKLNNQILIEKDAGIGSGFTNEMYEINGCKIIDSPKEIFDKSELIVKVKEPQDVEISYLNDEKTLFTFFHFAADEDMTDQIINSKSISIAYETVQNQDGKLP